MTNYLNLLNELRRLSMDIVGLSEISRPGHGKISNGAYTYYRHGMGDGTHLRVAVGS